MIEGRLKIRLMKLGIIEPKEYLKYLDSNFNEEKSALISLLTTHHTYFFREFLHFEHLQQLIESHDKSKVFRVWSAACSYGQEVYSIATFIASLAPQLKFEVYGSDVDPKAVETAKNGVYKLSEVKQIPLTFLQGHWQKGTGAISDFAKIKDHIRKNCHFESTNLTKEFRPFGGNVQFDVIFCRNVFIYFTPEQVKSSVSQMIKFLKTDGHLYLGTAEGNIINPQGLQRVSPSIFAKQLNQKQASSAEKVKAPIRVLIVDDSPSVQKILQKIFSSDPEFTVAGIAENGMEAHNFLKSHTVDLVTLDIHMPVMTGLEYLEKFHTAEHPPVLMVSSVSREDDHILQKAFSYGAKDYIEKPSLQNLSRVEEEMKAKAKMLLKAPKSKPAEVSLFGQKATPNNHNQFQISIFYGGEDQSVTAESLARHAVQLGSKSSRAVNLETDPMPTDTANSTAIFIVLSSAQSKLQLAKIERMKCQVILFEESLNTPKEWMSSSTFDSQPLTSLSYTMHQILMRESARAAS